MKLPFEVRDKISLANDVFSFLGNIGAGIGALLAFLGITSNLANNTTNVIFNVQVSSLSLPVRLTLLLLIAAALGWGIGAVVGKLCRSRNDSLSFIAYIVALLWGGLMVGAADWLAVAPRHQVLSETLLFTVAGTGLALWIAGFHFQSASSRSKRILRVQCDALLLFSIGSALFLALTLLGAGT
ncbi:MULTISPECIES: hypothetical protein [unclassified Ruegeria]|uniref:hypothetical protein n=1 Tax=unclassified Ruegeria TaxID=2625375 RepID=UPI0014889F80|nr:MULTISPECIES: hypothetical protein [unclassified Ruegeria]NOD77892.1 hypothetical protein [Ruegeria sp. HKCCD4332]NOD88123.1 hypothetical protein [Ruegeria sp. HKCCD4318]NOD93809.1 hypothetical protein [Ruegeria sp. HKCCD4884]NOE14971.1 hypothetical protein [Ruegeria sp. HKCCD4318-2]NOG11426.1 hypothetical protein [Ruegeria sp. HKCCD4315]